MKPTAQKSASMGSPRHSFSPAIVFAVVLASFISSHAGEFSYPVSPSGVATADHLHLPAHAGVLLVFSVPLILYQKSAVDPLVRLGSMTIQSAQSQTFLCSYLPGEVPASGLGFLILPKSNQTRCA